MLKNNFILISVHREENLDSDKKLIELIKALHQVHDKYKTNHNFIHRGQKKN